MFKVATRVRKTNSQTTALHPLHPKLSSSTSTLYFLPENLSLKSRNELRVSKESKNSYPHYYYLLKKCIKSYQALGM
jgi:hypothetical protein